MFQVKYIIVAMSVSSHKIFGIQFFTKPTESEACCNLFMINILECHDNCTLVDKIHQKQTYSEYRSRSTGIKMWWCRMECTVWLLTLSCLSGETYQQGITSYYIVFWNYSPFSTYLFYASSMNQRFSNSDIFCRPTQPSSCMNLYYTFLYQLFQTTAVHLQDLKFSFPLHPASSSLLDVTCKAYSRCTNMLLS